MMCSRNRLMIQGYGNYNNQSTSKTTNANLTPL